MTAEDPKAFADFVRGAISEEEWRAMSESSAPHENTSSAQRLIDLHDRDMARVSAVLNTVCAERDELRAENERLRESTFPKTWAGFRAFIDEQYPEDVFPDDDRDLGSAFVVAARRLAAPEVRLEAVRALHFPYDCTEAGESGHETCGEREWCYSCGEEQPWPCTTFQALRN